jgi:hypothetical protein
MKYIVLLSILFTTYSCNTSYQNVNNIRGQVATLKFKNGQTLQGNIHIESLSDYSGVRNVLFAEGNSNNYTSYPILDIDEMFYNGSTYAVRRIVGPEMFGGNGIRFIRQITQPNSKGFHLYESESKEMLAGGKVQIEMHLYVQLPNNKSDVYDAQSDWFIPNFNEKTANYFQDCPVLFQKIKNKQKGYFYALVNQGEIQRKQVWMNIWNDYNQCNK